jgi:cation transport regulator ChaC
MRSARVVSSVIKIIFGETTLGAFAFGVPAAPAASQITHANQRILNMGEVYHPAIFVEFPGP